MLASTGFSDNACFTHAFGKQNLAQAIIDFVAACVVQLIALEIDFSPAQMFCQAFCKNKAVMGGPYNGR